MYAGLQCVVSPACLLHASSAISGGCGSVL